MKINKKKVLFFILIFFIIVSVYYKYRSCNCYLYMGMSKDRVEDYCADMYWDKGECPNSCYLENHTISLESGDVFNIYNCVPNCEK